MARSEDGKEMVKRKLTSDPIDWACPSCHANPGDPCEGLRFGYVHQDRSYILVERNKVTHND